MAEDGDKDARRYLKVEVGDLDQWSVPTPSIDKKNFEKENMQNKINLVTYWVEAAKCLEMEHVMNIYRKELGLLIELYQALHGEMPTEVSGMNTKTIIKIMRLLAQKNVSDGSSLVLREEACRSAMQEDDAESGSNYQPTEDSHEEDSSEEEELSAAKAPPSAAKRPSSPAKCTPAKRQKRAKSLDPSKPSEVPTEDEKEEESSSATSASARDPSKRSHHKRKGCPVAGCKFNGNDLRRHVKKGDIEDNSVERLLAIVKARASQRAMPRKRTGKPTLRGRFKKWCPVPGCDRLVIDVGRHLCNSTYHQFKKGSREVQAIHQVG